MDSENWKRDGETEVPTCDDVKKYVRCESHLLMEERWRGQPVEVMFTEYRKGGELVQVELLKSSYRSDRRWLHRKDIHVLDILPTRGIPEPPERGRLFPRQ